jgi:hypothetical protein
MSGNNHNSSGPIKRDVLTAENSPVDAKDIKAIHKMSGRYLETRRLTDRLSSCWVATLRMQGTALLNSRDDLFLETY